MKSLSLALLVVSCTAEYPVSVAPEFPDSPFAPSDPQIVWLEAEQVGDAVLLTVDLDQTFSGQMLVTFVSGAMFAWQDYEPVDYTEYVVLLVTFVEGVGVTQTVIPTPCTTYNYDVMAFGASLEHNVTGFLAEEVALAAETSFEINTRLYSDDDVVAVWGDEAVAFCGAGNFQFDAAYGTYHLTLEPHQTEGALYPRTGAFVELGGARGTARTLLVDEDYIFFPDDRSMTEQYVFTASLVQAP